MKEFLKWLEKADLTMIALEIGLSIFIIVSFVRCSLGV